MKRLLFVLPLFFLGAQDGAPAVSLKSGKPAADLWQFPAFNTAPQTYEDMREMGFPKDDEFTLNFPATKPGWYTGPDGGKVYLWAKGSYRWNMQNGAEVIFFPNGTWQIKKDNLSFDSFIKSCPTCKNTRRLCFPDKTCIHGFYYKSFGKRQYMFEDFANNRSHLLVPQKFRPLHENFDRYQFHYAPEHQKYVHAFRDWPGKNAFFSLLKKEWNFENPGVIPVVTFSSLKEFSSYHDTQDPNCTGRGRGGHDVILICNDRKAKDAARPPSDDPLVRAVQFRSEYIGVMLHETNHNMQQLRCKQLAGQGKAQPVPENWLMEGQSDLAAMLGEPMFRARNYQNFYKKYIHTGKKPDFNGDPYLAGSMFLEYLGKKYGLKSIGDVYAGFCSGKSMADAFSQVYGTSRDALVPDMTKFYQELEPTLPASYLAWSTEGAPQLAEGAAGSSSRVASPPALPASAAELTAFEQIPDILHAYDYDTSALAGLWALVRGGRGEGIELYMNGSYRVFTADWEATVFPGNSVTLKIAGYEIINWTKSTQRRIKFPDGTTKTLGPSKR